jgi:hypothetical protein
MGTRYRSRDELRSIIRSVIADANPPPLSSFSLTPSEEVYFRARSARIVDALAKKASGFRAYYALKPERPFAIVALVCALVIGAAFIAGLEVYWRTKNNPAYPVFAALVTLAGVSLGWWVVGGIGHRNTVRQNTNTLLFARFSQAPFSEAMHLFHHHFEYGLDSKVTRDKVVALRDSGDLEKLKGATSVGYMLNYFEFISAGVLRGDLDQTIVEKNIRGVLCYYYDKCEPYINEANRVNPRIYEHLIKMRTHYREP